MERCAASAGAPAFAATGVGAVIASGGVWLAARRYQTLAAANMAKRPEPERASEERFLGWAGFACAGLPTSSE